MSYVATVCRITEIQKHPNADRLQMCKAKGNTVIVGLDTKENDLVLLFTTDGQLSEEFAQANDLIRRKLPDGKPAGGMFDQNRKVRAQKLRGVKSEGFVCPLSYLEFTKYDVSKLKEGDEFSEINGHQICNKYFTPATLRAMTNRKKNAMAQPKSLMFIKHFDTPQLRQMVESVKPGSLCYIFSKLHGTSGRLGLVKEELKPTLYQRAKSFIINTINRYTDPFAPKVQYSNSKWTLLNGTRNCVLFPKDRFKDGYHGSEEFRFALGERIGANLKKGETLYFEIVGWANNSPIMPPAETKAMKDPEFTKQYGEKMYYSYGCPEGACEYYVYRITQTNDDGYFVELPWSAVKERCAQLNVKVVPELCFPFIYDGNKETLMKLCEELTEGPDVIDSRHIREGMVLRAEHGLYPIVLKNKAVDFKILEGIIKDNDAYVDKEEVA